MGRRGILPSLGAATSLIVAGVLCLVVVSGYVAFHGFPELGLDGSAPPLRLARPTADDVAGRGMPAIVIGVGRTSASTAGVAAQIGGAARVGGASARRGSARVGVRVPPAQVSLPRPAPPPGPVPVAPDPSPDPLPSPSASAPAGGGEETSQAPPVAPARPVRETVDRVRDLVAPVAPAPPAAVQPVVDEINGAVDQTVDSVDQTVGAVGQTVGAVGQTVGALLPQPAGG